MEWHLSKQGNILAITPERQDVWVLGACMCVRVCAKNSLCTIKVDVGWLSLGALQTDRQTDSKLIKHSGSKVVIHPVGQWTCKLVRSTEYACLCPRDVIEQTAKRNTTSSRKPFLNVLISQSVSSLERQSVTWGVRQQHVRQVSFFGFQSFNLVVRLILRH